MYSKSICAWCLSTLVFSTDPVQSVSHGICKPCKAKFDRELAALHAPLAECDSFVDKIQVEEVYY